MADIRCVLLDVDGTLIDSNDAHALSWCRVLREAGHPVIFEQVRPLIGVGGDKLLPLLAGVSEDSEEGRRLSEARREVFLREHLPRLRPTPGARDLLLHMRRAGLKRIASTSASEEELVPLLERAGVRDLVEAWTSSSDAEASKPDPDIFAAALKLCGCPAPEVLALGDTLWDVQAARRAGVGLVAVRCGGWAFPPGSGAVAVFDHPADLLARWDSSPFARGKPGRQHGGPGLSSPPG